MSKLFCVDIGRSFVQKGGHGAVGFSRWDGLDTTHLLCMFLSKQDIYDSGFCCRAVSARQGENNGVFTGYQ